MSRWSLTLPLFSFQRTGAFEARPSTLFRPARLVKPRQHSALGHPSTPHPTPISSAAVQRRNTGRPTPDQAGRHQPELLSQGACPDVRGQKRVNSSRTRPGPTYPGACDGVLIPSRATTPPAPRCPSVQGEPRTYNAGPLLSNSPMCLLGPGPPKPMALGNLRETAATGTHSGRRSVSPRHPEVNRVTRRARARIASWPGQQVKWGELQIRDRAHRPAVAAIGIDGRTAGR